MTPSTRFQAFACSGEWDWPWITAYLASRVSPSNLGNSVDQRSNLSPSTDKWVLCNVERKVGGASMVLERDFRGDASMRSTLAIIKFGVFGLSFGCSL